MFNKNLFNFLKINDNSLPTSINTVITLLSQRDDDRRMAKHLDDFKVTQVFTWVTIKGIKAVTFKMSDKWDASDILYLDIQENGRMFLSDGPLTSRTPFPYHGIARFDFHERMLMKKILNQLNSEEADIQLLLNSHEFCNLIPHVEATGTELIRGDMWYYLQFKEFGGKIYKFFGRPCPGYHKGYGCFENEAERSLKDRPGDFVLFVGSKWSSERRKRSFNLFYPEETLRDDYLLRRPCEVTYWINEDGTFEREYSHCDFMREQIESIIRENAHREEPFFYYGKTGEIKDHWDINLIPEKVTIKREDGRYTTLTEKDLPQKIED